MHHAKCVNDQRKHYKLMNCLIETTLVILRDAPIGEHTMTSELMEGRGLPTTDTKQSKLCYHVRIWRLSRAAGLPTPWRSPCRLAECSTAYTG